MDNRYITSADLKAARRFEAEQAATNDRNSEPRPCFLHENPRIVQGSKHVHVSFVHTWNRGNERAASRRKNQLVVAGYSTTVAEDCVSFTIDAGNPHAQTSADPMASVPVAIVDNNFVRGFLSRKHGRQQDAIVIDVGLIAKNGDFEVVRVGENLLDACHSRHPIADNDQLPLHAFPPESKFTNLLAIVRSPFARVFSTRTAHCLKLGSREMGSKMS